MSLVVRVTEEVLLMALFSSYLLPLILQRVPGGLEPIPAGIV